MANPPDRTELWSNKLSSPENGEQRSAMRTISLTTFVATIAVLVTEFLALRHRYFVNDDYQIIYTTWLRSMGKVPGQDFAVQSFHLLPELMRPLMTIVDGVPDRLWLLRIPFFLCLCALPALTGLITSRAFSKQAAPFAALASVLSWAVLERSLDIRPEPFLIVLLLGQLALTLHLDFGRRHAFGIGCLASLMLVLRLKTVVFLPLVLLWTWARPGFSRTTNRGRTKRPLRDLLHVFFGMAFAAAGIGSVFYASGLLSFFIDGNVSLMRIAAHPATTQDLRLETLGIMLSKDPLWSTLFLTGAGLWVMRGHAVDETLRAGGLLAFGFIYIVLNPAFYAYNFLVLLPLWSSFVGISLISITNRVHRNTLRVPFAVVTVTLLFATHSPRLLDLATRETNRDQLLLARALNATPLDTHVFALEGIGLFRPSLFDWRLSAVSLGLYQSGQIDLESQLSSQRPEIVIRSYRIPGWLSAKDKSWMLEHYVRLTPELSVLGKRLAANEVAEFRLARKAAFEIASGSLTVSGHRYADGAIVELPEGASRLETANSPALIRFHWPEALDLPPIETPYLIAPNTPVYE